MKGASRGRGYLSTKAQQNHWNPIFEKCKSYQVTAAQLYLANLSEHPLVNQALFLGSHYKVVCLILVVNNVLQVNSSLVFQLVEELLSKDVEESADFADSILLFASMVH
jgi:hypothetical protein